MKNIFLSDICRTIQIKLQKAIIHRHNVKINRLAGANSHGKTKMKRDLYVARWSYLWLVLEFLQTMAYDKINGNEQQQCVNKMFNGSHLFICRMTFH